MKNENMKNGRILMDFDTLIEHKNAQNNSKW